MIWNKQIIVTNHAQERFCQRKINFSKKNNNIIRQILLDLEPLNVRTISRIKNRENTYRVITKQGKTYIILEEDEACFVKTVYKSKISYNKLKLN